MITVAMRLPDPETDPNGILFLMDCDYARGDWGFMAPTMVRLRFVRAYLQDLEGNRIYYWKYIETIPS